MSLVPGRGMLFPRSYFADQFTPAQEAAMEAAQAAAEDAEDEGMESERHEPTVEDVELLARALSVPSDVCQFCGQPLTGASCDWCDGDPEEEAA